MLFQNRNDQKKGTIEIKKSFSVKQEKMADNKIKINTSSIKFKVEEPTNFKETPINPVPISQTFKIEKLRPEKETPFKISIMRSPVVDPL